MEFRYGLLILAAFLQTADADTNDTDRYALPPSKVNIIPCRKEALLLHPGVIKKQQMQNQHGAFGVEYQVQAHDGENQEWLVLCDLTTGKIISEQKLIGDAP